MNKSIYDDINEINKTFLNKKITKIDGLSIDSTEVIIHFKKGKIRFYHEQDCCENVSLEDFSGNVNLENERFYEIVEKKCNLGPKDNYDDSFTWTFYTIKTSKGYLDLRFYGTSNGYYSESITIEATISKKEKD